MSDDRDRRLAQLRQAHDSGILDEDTYRAAVAALGAGAAVEGSGALAQAGAVAAGAGGVAVGGNVHGNIYTGPPPQDPAEALRVYRRVLLSACRHLPLRGVDVNASDPTGGKRRLDLAQVYVDLDTTTQVDLTDEEKRERSERARIGERETRPLGVLEAAVANRCLVLLGDPGSGKSTFLNYLALCLAGQQAQLPGWPEAEAGAVPVCVVLRDLARCQPQVERAGEPCHLWNFVVGRLQAQNLAFVRKPLHQALEEGSAVVLLDGLDEIPTQAGRTFVRDAVAAFAVRYPASRILVTCRTLSYQDPAWRLERFPAFELAPFGAEKIDHFIAAWYAELSRLGVVKAEDADGLARRLREAVRRPDLWRLAPNPLLLTVMALVHTHKGRLPDARALLYEDTMDILLWRWEQIKAGGEEETPHLRQLLLDAGRTDVDLKRALWRLAFEAHREGGAGDGEALADVGEWRLQQALAALHPAESRDWAHDVITAIKMRAGLLLERAPGVYTFPHRTFQEYLAGAHLSAQAHFAEQATGLVEEGAFWREVVLLAVGRLVYLGGDTDKPLALVGELCPARAQDDGGAWRKAWLAGEVLVEAGLNRVRESGLGRDLSERVRNRLADLVNGGHLTPVERAAAGRALAKLGDPRPGVGVNPETGLPDIAWCSVPAGSFTMGSLDDRLALVGKETPQREVELPTFRMGRYPVTVAQFGAFVKAGGYQDRECWTEVGWTWVERRGRTGLSSYGEPFDLPNHPVMGVTWYEAVAFCRWLTEQLRQSGELEADWEISLPTESQWEKAARGVDGRIYPWGNDPDVDRANYADTGIGATSVVGCFPRGASPYGVADLSGNVWEWCATKWQESYKSYWDDNDLEGDVRRVLRGGAFDGSGRLVRCACRYWFSPNFRLRNYGFRLVASPVHL